MLKIITKLREFYKRSNDFLREELWRIPLGTLPLTKAFVFRILRAVLIVFRGIKNGSLDLRAGALTFYSLFALVPVLALLFGIAKGLGAEKFLEELLYDQLSLQRETVDQLILFSNSVLNKTSNGLMAGIAIVVLIWSVVKVLTTVDRIFNDIWQVNKSKDIFRKLRDYFIIILLAPGLMMLQSMATVFITAQINTIITQYGWIGYISPFFTTIIKIGPYVIIWLLLTLLYIIIPNKKVRFKPALVAGIIAGTLYQIVQWAFIKFQIGVTGYNAIYGSLAALPLFLAWIHISWTIILLGGEISFANQNAEWYDYDRDSLKISPAYRRLLSLLILHYNVKYFLNNDAPMTVRTLINSLNIPPRLSQTLLNDLVNCGLLNETNAERDKEPGYIPAMDINELSVSLTLEKLDEKGEDQLFIKDNASIDKLRGILLKFQEGIDKHPENVLLKDI